jgi:hypothetical protein
VSKRQTTTIDLPIEAVHSSHDNESTSNTFDQYRSVGDPRLMIFVKTDDVPPFRFKAGGWELLQSSIDLGLEMKAHIAENGFFMWGVSDDQSGWTETSVISRAVGEGETREEPRTLDLIELALTEAKTKSLAFGLRAKK